MSLFVRLQELAPQHGLSRFAGRLSDATLRPLRRLLIWIFAKRYAVDMADAQLTALDQYPTFNAFFTRALRPGSRPMPANAAAIASPADGYLSQHGDLVDGMLLQAKGHKYSLANLVADPDIARRLNGGQYLTVYLSPRDYHRVHAPAQGTLARAIAVPGRLFSVNATTEAEVENLFCQNERLVCEFDRYVLVLVGAMIVASIIPTWTGAPRSPYRKKQDSRPPPRAYQRGEEVARFAVGSTVVALFPPQAAELHTDLSVGAAVRLGESMGVMRDRPETP